MLVVEGSTALSPDYVICRRIQCTGSYFSFGGLSIGEYWGVLNHPKAKGYGAALGIGGCTGCVGRHIQVCGYA